MFKLAPLGVLVAAVIVGITVEIVERQSREAAYALVVLILLGIITFNAQQFSAQMNAILAVLGQKSTSRGGGSRPKRKPGQGR
jgi:hypothetical protein